MSSSTTTSLLRSNTVSATTVKENRNGIHVTMEVVFRGLWVGTSVIFPSKGVFHGEVVFRDITPRHMRHFINGRGPSSSHPGIVGVWNSVPLGGRQIGHELIIGGECHRDDYFCHFFVLMMSGL